MLNVQLIFTVPLGFGSSTIKFTCTSACSPQQNQGLQIANPNNNIVIEKEELIAFPNPAQDYITIKISLPSEFQKTENNLLLYDQSGKRIATYPLNTLSKELKIDIQNLSSGAYLFALSMGGYNAGVKKWIKKW